MTWVIVMAVCYVAFAAWFAWLLHLGFKRIKDDVGKSTIYPAMSFSAVLLTFPVVFAAVSKGWHWLIGVCVIVPLITSAIAFDKTKNDPKKRKGDRLSKKAYFVWKSIYAVSYVAAIELVICWFVYLILV